MLLQVVFEQQVLNLVDRARALPGDSSSQRRELTIGVIRRRGRYDLPNAQHLLAGREPVAVDPQQIAEGSGVATVGFSLRSLLGLNQHDLEAAIFFEHSHQPIVKATHFQNRHETAVALGLLSQPREKRPHGFPTRADLPFEQHIALFVTQIHGQLLAMLVDGKVQHLTVLLS